MKQEGTKIIRYPGMEARVYFADLTPEARARQMKVIRAKAAAVLSSGAKG